MISFTYIPSTGVSMALKAHKPTRREIKILQQWLKERDVEQYKRAQIVMMSISGRKTEEIARWVGVDPRTVRRWIQAFNRCGIRGLKVRLRPGRPSKSNPSTEREILGLLEHKPEDFGIFKARWTLQDLASVFSSQNGLQVSHEWIRQQLQQIRYSFKRSKLRTLSQDPDYYEKKRL